MVTAVSTGLVAVIGIPTYLQSTRQNRRRDLESILIRIQEWESPEMLESRRMVGSFDSPDALRDEINRLRMQNDPTYYALMRIPNFFETLGLFVKYGNLNMKLVRSLLGSVVEGTWMAWRPVVIEFRTETGDPLLYEHFQTLAARMGKTRRSR